MTRPVVSTDIDRSEASPLVDADSAYDVDFYAWTQAQADALRHDDRANLDIPNLIEEIDSLGRAQIHALRSRYFQLCVHLLKLARQPERTSRSWHATISHQRIEIGRLLKDSPSLKSKRTALFAEAYQDARRQASVETSLDIATFPTQPPFSINEAEGE